MINKRKLIKAYFNRFNFKWLIVLCLLAISLLAVVPWWMAIILPMSQIALYFYRRGVTLTDQKFDKIFKSELESLGSLLRKRIAVDPTCVLNEYMIVSLLGSHKSGGLGFLRTRALSPPRYELKKGADGKFRGSPILYQQILCMEDKLVVAATELDLFTGNLLNTRIFNVYFNEVTTYFFKDNTYTSWGRGNTKEKKTTLWSGGAIEINLSRTFVIETRGGEKISIHLPDLNFIENVDDSEPHQSEAGQTTKALQKLLDDKKTYTQTI